MQVRPKFSTSRLVDMSTRTSTWSCRFANISRAATAMSRPSLAEGSLVWAKLPAFPWWPAKVTDVAGSDIYVTFCGTGDMGTVLRSDAIPYASRLSLREVKQKERWKKKFKQAIEEADCHAGLVGGAEPADAQGEIAIHDEAAAGPQAGEEKAEEEAQAEAGEAEEEEAVVLDASMAADEDSSEDERAGPSKGKEQSKGASSKRQLPADPGLPGWREPPVGNALPRSLARATHSALPAARRHAVTPRANSGRGPKAADWTSASARP